MLGRRRKIPELELRILMAKRRSKHDRPLAPQRPVVVVCRGGDCGSQLKHPGADHATQLRRLRGEIHPETATVTISKCLNACDHSNVIVVEPGAEGRAAGAETVWVGGVLDQDVTSDVIAWVNQTCLTLGPCLGTSLTRWATVLASDAADPVLMSRPPWDTTARVPDMGDRSEEVEPPMPETAHVHVSSENHGWQSTS
jgi:hypothetical protein